MDTSPPSPAERLVRCWCGHDPLEDWSPDYRRCPACQTLVLREMRGEEISRIRDDDHDFYGKNYYLRHVQEDYGLPDLETRARTDLPERCLHWLRALLKFVPGPGARTLELGCGHGGFVAMQRWAGLDASGLELSPWLVRQARAWFEIPVLEGRLEDQQLVPASFDAVALMDVLEHLPDPRATLALAVSLLRSPGGFLLIQTPCYPAEVSHETMLAQNHPFLTQLKPQEHLYLFSEQALARLCTELGVGQVRFEPAIFAHYDQFAAVSAERLPERSLADTAATLMTLAPPARETLALLDSGEERRALTARLVESGQEISRLHTDAHAFWPQLDAAKNAHNLAVAQREELQRHLDTVQADHAARLEVIERQGAEVTRLHAEADKFWPQLDAARHEGNLHSARLVDLQQHFDGLQADHAARLEVIERQGAEIARLHADAHAFWPQLDAAKNAHNLAVAQREELQRHFDTVQADHAARLEVIERQGAELGELRAQLSVARDELSALHGQYRASEADRADRLRVIEDQGATLGHLQARLAAAEGAHVQLAAELDGARAAHADLSGEHARLSTEAADLRAAHATLSGERTRLVADVDTMTAAHAALAAEHTALRARHRTLNRHWTTWVLKRLRLWPL